MSTLSYGMPDPDARKKIVRAPELTLPSSVPITSMLRFKDARYARQASYQQARVLFSKVGPFLRSHSAHPGTMSFEDFLALVPPLPPEIDAANPSSTEAVVLVCAGLPLHALACVAQVAVMDSSRTYADLYELQPAGRSARSFWLYWMIAHSGSRSQGVRPDDARLTYPPRLGGKFCVLNATQALCWWIQDKEVIQPGPRDGHVIDVSGTIGLSAAHLSKLAAGKKFVRQTVWFGHDRRDALVATLGVISEQTSCDSCGSAYFMQTSALSMRPLTIEESIQRIPTFQAPGA